jgi:AsmA protein
MRKIYVLAGLTVLSMILAIAAGLFLSTGWAVEQLKAKVEQQLGRSLSVAGGAHLEFAPSLALRFDTVDLANAPGLDGAFISAEAVRIPVTYTDLVERRLVGKITLVKPQISLEINDKGDVSWAAPEKGPLQPVSDTITLENGSLRYYDHRNDQNFELDSANAAVTLTPEGEVTFVGSALIGGRPAGITAYIKALPRVDTTGSPLALTIDSPALQVSFDGRLATANALNLVGPVSLSGPSLRDVAKWLGAPVPGTLGFGAFALSGALEGNALDFTVRAGELRLDDLSATGDVGLSLGGASPQVLAKLAFDTLDLGAYVAGPDIAAASWSEEPLVYAGLRSIDGRASLTARTLRYSGIEAGNATIEASLAAGRLGAVVTSDRVAGGNARFDVEFDGSAAEPVFSFHVEGQNLDGAAYFGGLAGQRFLTGPANVAVNLSGYGTSTAAIVSTLKGTAEITAGPGSLSGLDAKGLLAAVSQQIVQGWQRGGAVAATPFTSLHASFAVTDGIADTKDLNLAGAEVTVTGSGQADLLRRALDLSLTPRLVTGPAGETTGLPVPVIVKGPWVAPRLYPDVADILLKPAEAFGRLKSMGLPQSSPDASGN